MNEPWEIFAVLSIGLALAGLGLRRFVRMPPLQRPGHGIVLLGTGLLGIAISAPAHALFAADGVASWSSWPFGLLAGLAVVELGPPVGKAVTKSIAEVSGWVRRRLGGGA